VELFESRLLPRCHVDDPPTPDRLAFISSSISANHVWKTLAQSELFSSSVSSIELVKKVLAIRIIAPFNLLSRQLHFAIEFFSFSLIHTLWSPCSETLSDSPAGRWAQSLLPAESQRYVHSIHRKYVYELYIIRHAYDHLHQAQLAPGHDGCWWLKLYASSSSSSKLLFVFFRAFG
jgi:hypothetical protein